MLYYVKENTNQGGDRLRRGLRGQRCVSSSQGLVKLWETFKCQRTIGSRGLINRDASPCCACGDGRGATYQAGLRLVLSGQGRDLSGLANILSQPMGVDERESENMGYAWRAVALKFFGQGFDSPHPNRQPVSPGTFLRESDCPFPALFFCIRHNSSSIPILWSCALLMLNLGEQIWCPYFFPLSL